MKKQYICWLEMKIDMPQMGFLGYPFLSKAVGYLRLILVMRNMQDGAAGNQFNSFSRHKPMPYHEIRTLSIHHFTSVTQQIVVTGAYQQQCLNRIIHSQCSFVPFCFLVCKHLLSTSLSIPGLALGTEQYMPVPDNLWRKPFGASHFFGIFIALTW